MKKSERADIKAAIQWYEKRGRDWGDVVCFLALKYAGALESYIHPYGKGRPFSYKENR